MLRFLARALGLMLLALGFVGAVVDGTRSIANGSLSLMTMGELAFRLFGERYLQWQPTVERTVWPWLWDPVILNLLLVPASLLAFVLGALLLWAGRRPPEPIGYLARR